MSARPSTAAPAPLRAERCAYRSPLAWLVLLIVTGAGLATDLGSKSWSFRTIDAEPVVLERDRLLAEPDFDPVGFRARRTVLPWGLLDFKLVLNAGAVFGLGAHQRWFFVLFTLGAMAAGVHAFGRYTTARMFGAHVAIGAVMAGGLGNLYDRLAFGRVRDFIHVLPGRSLPRDWVWPGTQNPELFPWVFNFADVLLLAGMVALMVQVNRAERRRKAESSAVAITDG